MSEKAKKQNVEELKKTIGFQKEALSCKNCQNFTFVEVTKNLYGFTYVDKKMLRCQKHGIKVLMGNYCKSWEMKQTK